MTDRQPTTELGRLMAELRSASQGGDLANCLEPMSGQSRQVEGLRSESRFGDVSMVIDEPVSFGGTGLAPNPAEAMLAALGASLEVTLRCYADLLGVKVQSIGVDLLGTLDNRGFFDLDPAVRAGFPIISAAIRIISDEDPARLKEIFGLVGRCCPVLDSIRQPTPVDLSFLVVPS